MKQTHLINKDKTAIGIVGSRRRDTKRDYLLTKKAFHQVIRDYILTDNKKVLIVSGGCSKGGDRFAEKIAKDCGLSILIHYPNWATYGRTAGFVRNGKIAADSDILIAVVSEDRTGGTEDTIKKFNKGDVILV